MSVKAELSENEPAADASVMKRAATVAAPSQWSSMAAQNNHNSSPAIVTRIKRELEDDIDDDDVPTTPCSPNDAPPSSELTNSSEAEMTCSQDGLGGANNNDTAQSGRVANRTSSSSKALRLELYGGGTATPSPASGGVVSNIAVPASPEGFCTSTMPGDGPLVGGEHGSGKDDDSPKRLCLVCGDVASGFHYGVASCEACKAFFKRTIQGNIEYTCPASNDCEINKRRRKACQACRFQKCLKMGMLKEGVRLDRVRGGRQKYRRNPETHYPMVNYVLKKPSLEDNKLLMALAACEPEALSVNPDPAQLESDFKIVSILSDLVDKELVGTIGWAKQIPGFTDLSLNDQMRLLQSSWAEILGLALAYRSLPASGRLYFASDFTLDEKQARDCRADDVYMYCTLIVERLHRCNITREEYLLLKALLLINPDVKVDDHEALKKLRECLLVSLSDCVMVCKASPTSSSSSPGASPSPVGMTASGSIAGSVHLGALLLCLPVLRQVDTSIRSFWTMVRREGKVPMHKLFVEMLESHLR